jgi:16S rRNA (cytosine1402-N4)-methyltransferase
MIHRPVMVKEVMRYLVHDGSKWICDATVGCGGHARALLETNAAVKLIGLDRDPEALREAEKALREYGDRVQLTRGNFGDIGRLLSSRRVDGILADLGVSSLQLDKAVRGFSYNAEGPLSMRMSGEGESARDLIARTDARELATILKRYGEISHAMKIAKAIHEASDRGPMETTTDLREAVASAVRGEPKPALLSKVFQAIRIAVNRELESLDAFLGAAPACLNPGGTIVVVSYHSLEDRRVKEFIRTESRGCICPPGLPECRCGHVATLEVMTPRVVRPTDDEVASNPRARSARLRAARKLLQEQS